ncbi:MAG: hypothetical protein RLP02_31275, partial [Coleofasciculus sp. C2-GNP5-27]
MTSHFLSPDPSAAESSSSLTTWRRFRRQHPRLLVILGATGVLLLAGISIATWRLTNQAPQTVESRASRILPVETLTVQPVDSYQVSRTYTGEIAALRASDLGFERSGELVQVL